MAPTIDAKTQNVLARVTRVQHEVNQRCARIVRDALNGSVDPVNVSLLAAELEQWAADVKDLAP